ncbi:MAG TPA: hypothetical protein DIV86_05130 [Alphaproteobacteria bacterium]|mgnify:CR=1 FL=1|nr:hypothetical protein [Alphaproteobacteria bacterium]
MLKLIFFMNLRFLYLFTSSLLLAYPSLSFATGSNVTLEDKLCEIRLLFCNSTAVVIISISIIFIGFLIFMGKLHWTTVIIFVAGMIVFVQAHNVSKNISANPSFQVNAACRCQGTPP